MHLYFKHPGQEALTNRTKLFGLDVDLRGDGGYVVAPPSKIKGLPYIALDDGFDLPPLPNALMEMFGINNDCHTTGKDAKVISDGNLPEANRTEQESEFDENIITAIAFESLPRKIGVRHLKLSEYARRVWAVYPNIKSLSRGQKVQIFDIWWKEAQHFVGTQSRDVSLSEFLQACDRMRVPWGANPIDEASNVQVSLDLPSVNEVKYQPTTLKLLALCVGMELIYGPPWWVSYRDAADALGLNSHIDAGRLLQLLIRDGFIQLVKQGKPGGRKANRYQLSEEFRKEVLRNT